MNQAYGDVSDLVGDQMLHADWRDGMERHGYRFDVVRADAESFEVHAEPVDGGGTRSFTVTEDFVVRFAEGDEAPPGTSGRELSEYGVE